MRARAKDFMKCFPALDTMRVSAHELRTDARLHAMHTDFDRRCTTHVSDRRHGACIPAPSACIPRTARTALQTALPPSRSFRARQKRHDDGLKSSRADAVDPLSARARAGIVASRPSRTVRATSANRCGETWLRLPPETISVGAVTAAEQSHHSGWGTRSCRIVEVTARPSHPRRRARTASAGRRSRRIESPCVLEASRLGAGISSRTRRATRAGRNCCATSVAVYAPSECPTRATDSNTSASSRP